MCHLGFVGEPPAAAAPVHSARTAEFAVLRRVRDRLDRDYLRPLDVEALARAAGIPPRPLIRSFEIAYGRSPYGYLVARRTGPTLSSYCRTSQEEEG